MSGNIAVNVRCLQGPFSGVQRYTREIVKRLGDRTVSLSPGTASRGIPGHLWEQTVLPFRVRGRLLWSPANTGPLFYTNQVVTVHDMACFDHPEWFHPWFSRWYRTLIPRLLRKVRHVITVSEFSRRRILAHTGISPEKISVVYSGVGDEFSPRTGRTVEQCKQSLGIAGVDYVLSVGSLEPRKNLSGLLEAWDRALDSIPSNLQLLIAGPEGDDRVFRELDLAEIPERVRFLGSVSDEHLPALYSGAELFVYPSFYEGFGLPVLEAAACGTPVLVGEECPVNEVMGEASINVDPRDINAIKTRIIELLGDRQKRETMASRAASSVQSNSWTDTAERTLDCLQTFR